MQEVGPYQWPVIENVRVFTWQTKSMHFCTWHEFWCYCEKLNKEGSWELMHFHKNDDGGCIAIWKGLVCEENSPPQDYLDEYCKQENAAKEVGDALRKTIPDILEENGLPRDALGVMVCLKCRHPISYEDDEPSCLCLEEKGSKP